MKVMERVYRAANGVVELTRFYVSDTAQPRTGKKKASTPRKQEANKNQAIHILGRILNNNFSQGDLHIELTYDGKSFRALRSAAYASLPRGSREKKEIKRDAILDAAEADAQRFIRRLRDAGANACKYVLVPSDMDGTTGEEVRVHIHVILSGKDFVYQDKRLTIRGSGRTLDDIWGRGMVLHEFLRGGSYNKLAAYLLRQTRIRKNRKKYKCSKKMDRIEPEEYETSLTPSDDFQTPKGYRREEWQGGDSDRRAMQYARYVPEINNLDRKPTRRGKT